EHIAVVFDARAIGVDQCGAGAVGVVFPAGGLCRGRAGGGAFNELAEATVSQHMGGFAVVTSEIADGCGAGSFVADQLGHPVPVDLHARFPPGLIVGPLGEVTVRVGLGNLAAGWVVGCGGHPAQRVGGGGDFIQLRVGANGDPADGGDDFGDAAAAVVFVAGYSAAGVGGLRWGGFGCEGVAGTGG